MPIYALVGLGIAGYLLLSGGPKKSGAQVAQKANLNSARNTPPPGMTLDQWKNWNWTTYIQNLASDPSLQQQASTGNGLTQQMSDDWSEANYPGYQASSTPANPYAVGDQSFGVPKRGAK